MDIAGTPDSSCYWRYIDKEFYIVQCAKMGIGIYSSDPQVLAQHYSENAAEYELSPNVFFNERYYLKRYPEVASEVRSGQFVSGLDHFYKVGSVNGLSPNWFFDSTWYQTCNRDMTPDSLKFFGLHDVYTHFLVSGLSERRGGNWLMAALLKVGLPEAFPTSAADLRTALMDRERLARWLKPLFDAEWFAAKSNTPGDVALDIERYMLAAGQDRLSPSSTFDEGFYQTTYPEIATAVAARTFDSGFQHFLLHGSREGRQPIEAFDPNYYLSANPGVAKECRRDGLTPYYHYLLNRRTRSVKLQPDLGERPIPEEAGKGIFERRAAVVSSLPLRIDQPDAPEVSVIIVARNKYEQTHGCIASIAAGTKASFEVIVYDNASTDRIRNIASLIPGVRYVRNPTNKGFTVPVNEAAAMAKGRYIVLANNDIEIVPGAIDAAIRRLKSDPTIGVVGGRIIRSHGRLQEAGSIIWRDGTCLGYGRDFDPLDGRVLFPRDVDFCSACLLAISLEDWQAFGGFDPEYAPAYYEETDLCLRAWAAGKRVVYDPAVVLWHFEYGSSAVPEDAIALMRRNNGYFRRKHAGELARHLVPGPQNVEPARFRRMSGLRVLFLEDTIPERARGMGFARSSRIVEVLKDLAAVVTVVGLHPDVDGAPPPKVTGGLEVLRDMNHTGMVAFLRSRIGIYNHLWLSRTHNLSFLRTWWAEVPEFFENVSITLDTEAIASARTAHQTHQLDTVVDESELVSTELAGVELANTVCVVNGIDRALVERELASRGTTARVVVLGHSLPVQSELPRFERTAGIAFIGSFGNEHGPNVDAVRWFDEEARPLLSSRFKSVPFIIAGYHADRIRDMVPLRGKYEIVSDIRDMADIYRGLRIVLAPTRFAGGIPYKVHEASSYGVPVVMSELLGTQLGWKDQPELGIVPGGMAGNYASALDRLYFEKEAWIACQRRQTELVVKDCDDALFRNAIRNCLGLEDMALPDVGSVDPTGDGTRHGDGSPMKQRSRGAGQTLTVAPSGPALRGPGRRRSSISRTESGGPPSGTKTD